MGVDAIAHSDSYFAFACIKPDVASDLRDARSLDVEIFAPDDHHIFALPGKMTEAPCLADALVKIVFDKHDHPEVCVRPYDVFQNPPTK